MAAQSETRIRERMLEIKPRERMAETRRRKRMVETRRRERMVETMEVRSTPENENTTHRLTTGMFIDKRKSIVMTISGMSHTMLRVNPKAGYATVIQEPESH